MPTLALQPFYSVKEADRRLASNTSLDVSRGLAPERWLHRLVGHEENRDVTVGQLCSQLCARLTESRGMGCVFVHVRGFSNVREKTIFDIPASASVPGSPSAANPDMRR